VRRLIAVPLRRAVPVNDTYQTRFTKLRSHMAQQVWNLSLSNISAMIRLSAMLNLS